MRSNTIDLSNGGPETANRITGCKRCIRETEDELEIHEKEPPPGA